MQKSVRLGLGGCLLLTSALAAATQQRATVTLRLNEPLSTGSTQAGDTFTGTLAAPLVVQDRIVAEPGAPVIGQVREAVSAGRLKRPASITLGINAIEAPLGRIPLKTGELTVKAGSHAVRNLLILGGAMGTGTAIGGKVGGRKGAAIGAAAGASAGVATAYLTGKREIVLPSETVLTFHVTSVAISQNELMRLQRVPPGAVPAFPTVVRRDHDEDEDDEHEEYEIEHEYKHLKEIEVEFEDDEAEVKIRWPHRTERILVKGDNLEDIVEELAERTKLSRQFLRRKIKVKGKD